ncbi:MAG: flagellar hook-length control protein FliK, partial [Campylobacterales bacterium]|nr:flagellar hook-length control protein FliK [Campylobacterales bacterium]
QQRQALAEEAALPVKSDLKAAAAASSQQHSVKAEVSASPIASAAAPASVAVESTLQSAAIEEKLASLLFGEAESTAEPSTPQGTTEQKDAVAVTTFKADALEVKVKEAQQSLRHFATELREAVENYKPPFTRLKITLNPAKLGEVDVTMIQRGNNVHINVSSNSAALNLLAHNAAELKTQLANNGVVNTTMQFSTSHGEHPQQGQQQRSQTFSQSYRPLEALSEEELELITSIEITLPRYA